MKDEYDFSNAERGRFHRPSVTLVPPAHYAESTTATTKISDKAEAYVIRGRESWNFIYFGLAFSIAIEGTIIQMLSPRAPWNLLFYAILASATGWVFTCNGRFQNWIFTLKHKYESRAR